MSQAEGEAALRARREATVRTHMEREIAHDWDAVIATFAHPRYELMATGVVHDGEEAVREYFRAGRALVPLDPLALGEVVRLVVQLAHDHEHVSGDGPLVNALAGGLGRWARRRVRKVLGDTGPEEVAEIHGRQ